MAASVALSGGPIWGAVAWGVAWVAADLLFPRPSTPGLGSRIVIGLLAGSVALAVVPDLPWWIGLARAPWLVRDHRPRARLLGVWWIVLSLMTPFYHPYARLWLPLHAAGWLITGGLVADLLGSLERITIRGLTGTSGTAVAVGVVLAFVDGFAPPRARPMSGLLGPSDSLRRAVHRAAAELPARARAVPALVRPAVTFYAATEGRGPLRPVPGLTALVEAAVPGELVLVDGVQLRQESDLADPRAGAFRRWTTLGAWPVEMSPPTLLDVDPAAAIGDSTSRTSRLLLMRAEGPRPSPPEMRGPSP
jgi:hypothetical protein